MIEGFQDDYLGDLYDELDAAKERIEKLEAALRRIKHMHEGRGVDDIEERDDRTYFIVCNALEELQ